MGLVASVALVAVFATYKWCHQSSESPVRLSLSILAALARLSETLISPSERSFSPSERSFWLLHVSCLRFSVTNTLCNYLKSLRLYLLVSLNYYLVSYGSPAR
jgi:hypothetical protein